MSKATPFLVIKRNPLIKHRSFYGIFALTNDPIRTKILFQCTLRQPNHIWVLCKISNIV